MLLCAVQIRCIRQSPLFITRPSDLWFVEVKSITLSLPFRVKSKRFCRRHYRHRTSTHRWTIQLLPLHATNFPTSSAGRFYWNSRWFRRPPLRWCRYNRQPRFACISFGFCRRWHSLPVPSDGSHSWHYRKPQPRLPPRTCLPRKVEGLRGHPHRRRRLRRSWRLSACTRLDRASVCDIWLQFLRSRVKT